MSITDKHPWRKAIRNAYERVSPHQRSNVAIHITTTMTQNPSEQIPQFSTPREVASLPPYEPVETTTIPVADNNCSSNSSDLSHDSGSAENRKSNAVSISQALDDHDCVRRWPSQPRKLRNRTIFTCILNFCEALITLAPVAFIVFAILAAKLDDQPTDGNGLGHNVKMITQLGPTIYPIMFAAVAGRSLKILARFYAERGMRLGVLELLLASQTVWGTFESQVLLRHLTLIGAQLFLLWSLSPLGGQGSLRILTTTTAAMVQDGGQIVYLPTSPDFPNMEHAIFMFGDAATGVATTNILYNTNLLSPDSVKLSGQDVWGNIKVPNLKTISNVELSNDGWGTVPYLSSPDNYTSLSGLPMSGLLKHVDTVQDFYFENAYVELDCPVLLNMSADGDAYLKTLGIIWGPGNGTGVFYDPKQRAVPPFFMDTNTPINSDRIYSAYTDQNATTFGQKILQQPRNLVYGSRSWDSPYAPLVVRNCTMQQKYVEARAKCKGDGCAVVAIRPSLKYAKRNPNLTRFEEKTTVNNLFTKLPWASGIVHTGDSAATELYIRGATMPYGGSSEDYPPPLDIPDDVFTTKFQLLLNTYYQLGLAPLAYTTSLPPPTDPDWDLLHHDDKIPFAPVRTNSTTTTTFEVYKCNYVWFSILMTSSIILVMLGSVGTALSHLCQAPDMLGYVSSFTYNNPYMSVPSGGESLGAMERARLLKNVKVKIGDANAEQDVGHVVFATLHRSSTIGDLNAAKLYR